jgi:polar amino acid transport system substrate-binding protein
LTICYEEVVQQPWTRPDGTGLNFELLKRVESQLGEHFRYAPKPWKRCIEEVRMGKVDAAIGAADSAERRQFGALPTLPDGRVDARCALYEEGYRIFLRPGGPASWDGKTLLSPSGVVLVQSGYIIADVLRARGFKPSETARSAEDGLRLVANGTYDIAVLFGPETEHLARTDPRFKDKVVLAPIPYEVLPLFLLFARSTYSRDSKRVDAIWAGIRSVRESSEYRKLEAAARR